MSVIHQSVSTSGGMVQRAFQIPTGGFRTGPIRGTAAKDQHTEQNRSSARQSLISSLLILLFCNTDRGATFSEQVSGSSNGKSDINHLQTRPASLPHESTGRFGLTEKIRSESKRCHRGGGGKVKLNKRRFRREQTARFGGGITNGDKKQLKQQSRVS